MSKWINCANGCGCWVWPKRKNHIYCSDKCRNTAMQRRKYHAMSVEKRRARNRKDVVTEMIKWRKIERDVMQKLGLKPTALSGGGWLEKEDGESDNILAQLKSTARKSISIKQQDLKDLIRHSRISHKLPVFVLYFVGDEPYILVRAGDLQKAAKYVKYPLEEKVKDVKSESGGERGAVNPPNPVQIRGAVSKEIRRSNSKIPY